MSEEQDNELKKSWLEHSFTRQLVKHYHEKLATCQRALESAARRSTDPEVRETMTQVTAIRVILAELQAKDTIEGAGQQ